MPKTVGGFNGVFAENIVRRVTVVASGDGVMARFLPAVILLLHNVAIGARVRIIAHIRITLRINKRIKADSDSKAGGDTENDKFNSLHPHHKDTGWPSLTN